MHLTVYYHKIRHRRWGERSTRDDDERHLVFKFILNQGKNAALEGIAGDILADNGLRST